MAYQPVQVPFDPTKTLIVPMDSTYQNGGMYKAYGLIFRLLYENVINTDVNYKPIYVYWTIDPSKDAFTDIDFTANTKGYNTTLTTDVHQYSGGPFIIQSENLNYVKTLINAWNTANTVSSNDPTKNTKVAIHELVDPVTINTIAKLIRPPRISVEDANAKIPIKYLNAAGLPDYYQVLSLPNPAYTTAPVWTENNTSVLDPTEINGGDFFGVTYQLACQKLAYDIFISPHTGESTWVDPKLPNILANLDNFLKLGGVLHSMCASIEAIENNAKFLTTSGINSVDQGTNFLINTAQATNPLLQAVNTDDPQALPGGSVQTWLHSAPNTVYKSLTKILAYFTKDSTQYDFMIAGQYQGSTVSPGAKGAGAIVYEGGHEYTTTIPYTDSQEDMYTKFVLNSIFLSVTKPLIELTMTPNPVNAGTQTNVAFSIKNIGGAVAENATISVTLLPGMINNGPPPSPNSYSMLPSSIVGDTLTWSNVTLDGGQAITFNVTGYTHTSTAPIDFTATYGDQIFATSQNPYTLDACSILAVVPQDTPVLLITKKVDGANQTFIEPGDSVVFTYTITNVGDRAARNIEIVDPNLFNYFNFTTGNITGSVNISPIDITTKPQTIILNPALLLTAGSTITVTVNAQHDENAVVPPETVPPDTIINIAYVNYINNYNPGNPIKSPNSNTATTNIVLPDILAEKSVDKTNAAIGDTLKYKIEITNPGNTVITKVNLIDNIPDGTSYKPGTLNVTTNISPLTSISYQYNAVSERIEVEVIGELDPIPPSPDDPTDIITVEFDVIVNSIPPNPIPNVAIVNYTYKIGDQATGNEEENSTSVKTNIASLQIAKTAPQFVKLGEELTYTISLTNNGLIPLTNVKVVDTIPDGTTYVNGSVTGANFVSQVGQVITLEVPLINPAQPVTVTIKVKVNTLPLGPSYTITNLVSAIFTVDGDEKPPVTATATSTVVEGKIKVDKGTVGDISNAKVGDIIPYEVVVTNTGNVDVKLTNLADALLPNGYASPSIFNTPLNITLQPTQSTTLTYNATVTAVPPGTNPKIDNTAIITFDYLVGQTIVPNNKAQDSYSVNIQTLAISVVKKVDPTNAAIGDILTYTVDITNTGTVNLDTVTFTDLIPTGTSYVGPINVTTDITPTPTISKNYIVGPPPEVEVIVTGQIKPLNKITITFKVKVDSIIENPIENKADVEYVYKLNPNEDPRTGTETSDPVYTDIASLIITKEAPEFVKLGENLIYKISITNNGQVDLTNVQIKDTIPDETTFINATVNGATKVSQQVSGNNVTVVVNPVSIGSTVDIFIEVSVDTLPPSPDYQIKNSATAIYTVNGLPKQPVESEEVTTTVQEGKIEVNKGTVGNITYAKVGDTVTYEVEITNTGNIPVTLSDLNDSIEPSGYTNPDTININVSGIVLQPNESITRTYSVLITGLPSNKKIDNIALVDFYYEIGGEQQPIEQAEDAYTLNVEEIKVSLTKTVDKTYAEPGDELKYTFKINNQSSVPITNVYLFDSLPANTTFADSFSLDPTQNPTIFPGAFVGTIAKNTEIEVSFKVKVNSSLTSPVDIINAGSITYNYKLNPNEPGPGVSAGPVNSSPVTTKVQIPKIEIIKSVSDYYVEVDDIVTYTLTVKNTGTVDAKDVEVIDILPAELQFISPVTVNPAGVWIEGTNPSYIKISSITVAPPNNVVTIQFNAKVISRPQSGKIDNIAHANFRYSLDPTKPATLSKKNIPSNKVTITVQKIDVKILKTTTKSYVEVGENLTYTVQITNNSTVPVDTKFTDELPTEVEYVSGSFNVLENESAIVANNTTDNNLIKVDITGMPPQSLVIFSYTVTVLSLPTTADPQVITNKATAIPYYNLIPGEPRTTEGDPVTDEVTTPVKLIKLKVTKSVDESVATVGDILHYTVTIINTGNTTAENVVFSDNVPDGTKFVEGSLIVDGELKDSTPEEGVDIGEITPTQTVIVKFNVEVIAIPQPPNEPIAENTALVTFDVELDGVLQPRDPVTSNPVETELVKVQLEVVKTVNKDTANVGDTLTYTVVIKNTGDVTINNVIFNDVIPEGTILTGTQPVQNVNLGSIDPGKAKTVIFTVKIVSKPCPPKLINKAIIKGDYTVKTERKLIIESNEAVTYVGITIFKQFSVDENLTIPTVKPDAEDILEVIADVEITYTNVIKTPIVTSYEGQQLTGWKLIVEGKLKQKISYIADEPTQSVHAAEFDVPFSTFLVLPKDYKECQKVNVVGIIEDVFVTLIDKRTIFKNVTLMLQGKTGC